MTDAPINTFLSILVDKYGTLSLLERNKQYSVCIRVVSRQVFGGTGQIETRFEKPRRVETGFETTQNLIHSSK